MVNTFEALQTRAFLDEQFDAKANEKQVADLMGDILDEEERALKKLCKRARK